MFCFVYIVKCRDEMLYTGITWNIKKRINEHNSGVKTPLQKSRLPVKLVYWEKFDTRIEAAKREKVIKGWRREKKLNLINSLR
jgi:putative endonuclease